MKDRWVYTSSSSETDREREDSLVPAHTPTRGQARYGLRRDRVKKDHQRGCPCCQYHRVECKMMGKESLQIPTDPPLKGTSTIGSRGGGPPEDSCGNPSVVQVKQMKSVEEDRELVTELRFRAQFIHLGLSERSSVESTLERMKATKIQELDQIRFKEWTRDQKGLEFTQVMTVPYETPKVRIVMDESEVKDRVWIRCASREVLAQKQLNRYVGVGEAVQMDWRTWCLVTADTVKERVKPENLAKAWRSLMYQQLPSQNLAMQAFDWHRGAFHFQDWYRLIDAHMPNGWDMLIVASRNHQLPPMTNVKSALKLVDSWMKINLDGQKLPRSIWTDLENICPARESKEKEPPIGRYIRYKDKGIRPNYSAFISYSEEDFLSVQGNQVLAMPADMNPRSAMAQAILREYDKERIFRLRPKVGSVIHVDSDITGQPGVNLWLLIVRSSQWQVALLEDLHSTLQELASRLPDDSPTVLHLPMLDMERGLNHLPNLYAMLDEVFQHRNTGIVLHDRIFVTIGQVQVERQDPP